MKQPASSYDWDYPNPHIYSIKVAAADIDGMGHANNACYVVWSEDCAWDHSQSLGLTVADYQQLDRGVAIHKASYEYYLTAVAGEDLTIATWLTDWDGKLRLERRFQMINTSTGETVQRGHWQLICVTLTSGKATRFPREFKDLYGGAVIDTSLPADARLPRPG